MKKYTLFLLKNMIFMLFVGTCSLSISSLSAVAFTDRQQQEVAQISQIALDQESALYKMVLDAKEAVLLESVASKLRPQGILIDYWDYHMSKVQRLVNSAFEQVYAVIKSFIQNDMDYFEAKYDRYFNTLLRAAFSDIAVQKVEKTLYNMVEIIPLMTSSCQTLIDKGLAATSNRIVVEKMRTMLDLAQRLPEAREKIEGALGSISLVAEENQKFFDCSASDYFPSFNAVIAKVIDALHEIFVTLDLESCDAKLQAHPLMRKYRFLITMRSNVTQRLALVEQQEQTLRRKLLEEENIVLENVKKGIDFALTPDDLFHISSVIEIAFHSIGQEIETSLNENYFRLTEQYGYDLAPLARIAHSEVVSQKALVGMRELVDLIAQLTASAKQKTRLSRALVRVFRRSISEDTVSTKVFNMLDSIHADEETRNVISDVFVKLISSSIFFTKMYNYSEQHFFGLLEKIIDKVKEILLATKFENFIKKVKRHELFKNKQARQLLRDIKAKKIAQAAFQAVLRRITQKVELIKNTQDLYEKGKMIDDLLPEVIELREQYPHDYTFKKAKEDLDEQEQFITVEQERLRNEAERLENPELQDWAGLRSLYYQTTGEPEIIEVQESEDWDDLAERAAAILKQERLEQGQRAQKDAFTQEELGQFERVEQELENNELMQELVKLNNAIEWNKRILQNAQTRGLAPRVIGKIRKKISDQEGRAAKLRDQMRAVRGSMRAASD